MESNREVPGAKKGLLERLFEKETTYGYIQYADRYGNSKRQAIKRRFVWIGFVFSPIKGEVASNVWGIIQTMHEGINLSILVPPPKKKKCRTAN